MESAAPGEAAGAVEAQRNSAPVTQASAAAVAEGAQEAAEAAAEAMPWWRSSDSFQFIQFARDGEHRAHEIEHEIPNQEEEINQHRHEARDQHQHLAG